MSRRGNKAGTTAAKKKGRGTKRPRKAKAVVDVEVDHNDDGDGEWQGYSPLGDEHSSVEVIEEDDCIDPDDDLRGRVPARDPTRPWYGAPTAHPIKRTYASKDKGKEEASNVEPRTTRSVRARRQIKEKLEKVLKLREELDQVLAPSSHQSEDNDDDLYSVGQDYADDDDDEDFHDHDDDLYTGGGGDPKLGWSPRRGSGGVGDGDGEVENVPQTQAATINIAYLGTLVAAATYYRSVDAVCYNRNIQQLDLDIQKTLSALRDLSMPIVIGGAVKPVLPALIPEADGTEKRFTNVARELGLVWSDVPAEEKAKVYERANQLHHQIYGRAPTKMLAWTNLGRRIVDYYDETTSFGTVRRALREYRNRTREEEQDPREQALDMAIDALNNSMVPVEPRSKDKASGASK